MMALPLLRMFFITLFVTHYQVVKCNMAIDRAKIDDTSEVRYIDIPMILKLWSLKHSSLFLISILNVARFSRERFVLVVEALTAHIRINDVNCYF
jgi:hypothetical protein